jgi:hypothetical protein
MAGLPLFPLGSVLFPGRLLPLHVFEERYRALVRDLLSAPGDRRELGVVAIRAGREVGADSLRALHEVGCVAQVRRVDRYADGRFDVITVGTRRFRLRTLDHGAPYLRGAVEWLEEPEGDGADALAAQVAAAFTAYRAATGKDDDALPGRPRPLSYLVAASTVLDLTDRQRLLAAPDTATRLRAELGLLHRESALLGLLPSLPAVDLTRASASPN